MKQAIKQVAQCDNCGCRRVLEQCGTFRLDRMNNPLGGAIVVENTTWLECDNCGKRWPTEDLSRRMQESKWTEQQRAAVLAS